MTDTFVKIECLFDSMVHVSGLTPHPLNRNIHSDEQIERLAEMLKYQGIRAPIVVSKRSHYIVKGHGTLQAIKRNKWEEAPVVFQDFADDEQEYAFLQGDNAIASWARLDLSGINTDLGGLDPSFDLNMLGIKNFHVDVADKGLKGELVQFTASNAKHKCPQCGYDYSEDA